MRSTSFSITALRYLVSGILFLAVFLFSATSYAADEAAVKISLHPKALVRGQEFTIGEIASIEPAQSGLADQVRKLVVSRSPWPGYSQDVTPNIVRMVVEGRIQDLSLIKIGGAKQCTVQTASVKIPAETILTAAKDHIQKQLPWAPEEVSIKNIDTPQDRYVPVGVGDGPVLEITDGDRQTNQGLIRLKVRVIVDERVAYQTVVGFSLKTYQNVLVVKQHIHRGGKITDQNVAFQRMEIDDFSARHITKPQDAYGKLATRGMRAGTIVTEKMLQAQPVIGRRGLVDIIYKSGALRIKLKGIAEEPGAPGEIIRVRSTGAINRQLYCRVINSKTVEIAGK